MDLFDENSLSRLDKDEKMFKDFADRNMNIQVLSSSDPSTSYESLLQIKYLFQKMLPKMPKDYILRQVFDEHHCCLTLNQPIEGRDNICRIVGAVCYRPCFGRNLIEIVFLAIDSDFHVSGYGTFLFDCFKEICKLQRAHFQRLGEGHRNKNIIITSLAIFDSPEKVNLCDLEINKLDPQNNLQESPEPKRTKLCPPEKSNGALSSGAAGNKVHGESGACDVSSGIYLLTYADNSAIGFFKKQGFSLFPRSTGWQGYIKDYEGGTLMECKIHRDINYLRKRDIIKRARNAVFSKMREINDFHILYLSSDRKNLAPVLQGYQAKENHTARTKEQFLADFLYFLICTLQTHPSSWPFLDPVSAKDVPDYFDVIKHPMDMSLMMKKIKVGAYTELKAFSSDVYLMCGNCFNYNGPDTQYYKCAEHIKKSYDETINKYKDTICRWGYNL